MSESFGSSNWKSSICLLTISKELEYRPVMLRPGRTKLTEVGTAVHVFGRRPRT